jgi:hypothetical protein
MNPKGAFKKKQKNIENIKRRYALLTDWAIHPKCIDKRLSQCLNSQSLFGSLRAPDKGIEPLSLNTMKVLSDELYGTPGVPGSGFSILDELRIKAKNGFDQLCKNENNNKSPESVDLSEDPKKILELTEWQNILLCKFATEMLCQVKEITKDIAVPEEVRLKLIRILENHHKIYKELFDSISASPSSQIDITTFRKSRK